MNTFVRLSVLGAMFLFLCSCSNTAQKISISEIDTMPLVDVHCHAEMPGAGNTGNVLRMIVKEKMTYILMLCSNYDSVLEMALPYRKQVGIMLYFQPSMQGRYHILDSLTMAHRDIVRGYKLHPSALKHDITTELLDSLFMLANKYNLLIVTHTDSAWSCASKYKPLLSKYPDTRLILYHAAPAEEAFELVNAYKNVYLDVSFTAWGKDFQQKALKAVGKDKILFGIDSPLGFPTDTDSLLPHFRQAAKEVAAFYNFDRETVESVFYKNAIRLLNLKNE